jgi:hypothetical protein
MSSVRRTLTASPTLPLMLSIAFAAVARSSRSSSISRSRPASALTALPAYGGAIM